MNKRRYTVYKNLFTKIIKYSMSKYYQDQFFLSQNNIKNTWRLIKENLGSKTLKNESIKLNIENSIILDKKEIGDTLNRQFSSIGHLNSLNVNPKAFVKFLPTPIPNSFVISNIDEHEVMKVIQNFKNKYSAGDDDVSNFLLKLTGSSIIIPLTFLINLSFEKRKFPSVLKISKIIPLFKKGSKLNAENYRPISLVSSFSKLLERLMSMKLIDFWNKHDFFNPNQYGFKKNSSTELAVLDLCHFVSDAIENKTNTLGVFIDLSKAFDSIDHGILLHKLYHYGIRGPIAEWFKSYLTDRSQYVHVDGVNSDRIGVTSGVPQGSILGPLLFNVFMNDISNVSSSLKFILFADDTTVLLSGRNITELVDSMNKELSNLSEWIICNNLLLNINKTCCMLFGPRIVTNLVDFSLYINSFAISRVNSIKFLGIVIEDNLSWREHIEQTSNKIAKNIGVLFKISYRLPNRIIKMLYYAIIYPYLLYGLALWGNSPVSHLNLIRKTQNSYLRLLFHLNKHDNISHYYDISGLLNINQLYIFKILLLSFYLITLKISKYFLSIINNFLHNSSRCLRHNPIYYLAKPRTNLYYNGPLINCLKYWNELPNDIVILNSKPIFKKTILKLIRNNVLIKL